MTDFRDHALATIRDIEGLAKLGKSLGTCPYYATRSAIKPSEVCCFSTTTTTTATTTTDG